jgi:hypothetical protein
MALGFLAPLAVSLIGGLLKKKGQKKQQQAMDADYQRRQAAYEKKKAARSAMLGSILKGYGIDSALSPDMIGELNAPGGDPSSMPMGAAGGPAAPGESWQGGLGSFLQSISPYLGKQALGGEMMGGGAGMGAGMPDGPEPRAPGAGPQFDPGRAELRGGKLQPLPGYELRGGQFVPIPGYGEPQTEDTNWGY